MLLEQLHVEDMLPATFTAPGLTEEQFLALCEKFPDATLEYTEDGTVIVMPPTDPRSGAPVAEIIRQLGNWTRQDGRGVVLGPNAGFFFPRGSRRSPDASWFDRRRYEQAETQGLTFPVFAPEFVIEVRSRHDRLRTLREKMEEYLANGVQLGWLIDPFRRTVEIYRPGRAAEMLEAPQTVEGEGPVAGFVLRLDSVFGF